VERSSVEFPYLYRTRIDPDVGILEASGDTAKANKILTVMKEMDFGDYQIEMIDLYKEQAVSKKQLMKYWTGEIEYEQIGEK